MTEDFKAPQADIDPILRIQSLLHGMEYPLRIPKAITEAARANGIVIVYGASDDLMELEGAIHDEFGCYEGGTAKLDAKGLLQDWDSVKDRGDKDEITDWLAREKAAKSITAIWGPSEPQGASWAYETAIPHATFDVMEDGGIYCRGLLIRVADLHA
ncbi:hypothetical protein [Delftia acidovorans]|uniref:hypothetical protein n=1 Tax=Delftia acidovorans TaxID=80866 RepID=UPI0033422A07